jgi:hypothetical protein
MTKAIVSLILCLICFPLPSVGAPQIKDKRIALTIGPVTIYADHVTTDSYRTKARGNVYVEIRGAMKLQADEFEVVIERDSGLVDGHAKGRVRAVTRSENAAPEQLEQEELKFMFRFVPG